MAAISTTVVTILDLGGYNPYRASVIGVDSTATTYTLACPPTGNGCGYGAKSPDITVVAGPSTAAQTVIVDSLTQFSTLACHVSASTQIVGRCSRVGVDRTSFTFEDRFQSITLVAVTVTAGAEKLSQDAGQTTATSADGEFWTTNSPTHYHSFKLTDGWNINSAAQ